jgi:hypothetical protein
MRIFGSIVTTLPASGQFAQTRPSRLVLDMAQATWDAVFGANLKGTFLCS